MTNQAVEISKQMQMTSRQPTDTFWNVQLLLFRKETSNFTAMIINQHLQLAIKNTSTSVQNFGNL